MKKDQYRSLIRFLIWKGNREAKSTSAWMLCTVTLLLRWRPSKIGLTSFNVVARRFLMSPGAPKTATTEDNVTKIYDLVSQNDHRALLCRIIGPIRRRIAEKTALFGEEKSSLPPWQRTGQHLRRRHGQIGRIRLRTAAPSTIFSRFGPVRLLFVSKLEKITRRAEIWVEWGGYRRHEGLLCRPPENVFFKRVKEVGASLGQVYRAKRRLCWKINCHFSKFLVFLL